MGRVIAMVNEKGGAGKTTAVVEIAYHAGTEGKTVLVVDLDPQGNATFMLTGGQISGPTVFDLFVDRDGKVPMMDAVCSALAGWPNTFVLGASGRMSTIDGHLGNRAGKDRILKRILQPIRDKIDLILIDLGPAADFLTLNALVAADAFHIPVDLSEYTLTGLTTILDLADDVRASGANPDLKFAGIHLSGFHKGNSHGVRGLRKRLGDLLKTENDILVPHSSKVIESQGFHRPVGSLDPEGRVAYAYKTLTERLLND